MSAHLPNLGDRTQARRNSNKGAFDVHVLINEIGGIVFQRNGEFFGRVYKAMIAPGQEEAFKQAHSEGKLAQFMADKASLAAEAVGSEPALISEANRSAASAVDAYLKQNFTHLVSAYEYLGERTQKKFPDNAEEAWDHVSREVVGNFRVLTDYVVLDQLEVARTSLGPSKSGEVDFEQKSSFKSGSSSVLANELLRDLSARLKASNGANKPTVR